MNRQVVHSLPFIAIAAIQCLAMAGEDPFSEGQAKSTAVVVSTVPRSIGDIEREFGILPWTLDAWPNQADCELRVVSAQPRSNPILLRLAVGAEFSWVERIVLSGKTEGSWGPVVQRIARSILTNAGITELIRGLSTNDRFWEIPSELEEAYMDSFRSDSIWLFDFFTREKRNTLLVRNIDTLDGNEAPGVRDFSAHLDLIEKLSNLLASKEPSGK